MADLKISALTAATTPLAGTEVLPIVQSGATVKVANNDLRPKQIQSNATSGVLQVAGPGAAATRVMTTPDANFTVARTDAAQTFTGNQQFSNSVGVGGAPNVQFEITSASGGTVRVTGTGATVPQLQLVSGGIVNWSLRTNQNGGSDFTLYQDSTERILVASGGNTTLKTGNLIIGTAGKGVSLPGGITWTSGAGSPEGVVTAPIGSLYSRSDGGVLTSFYVKQSGTGNTGWAAK